MELFVFLAATLDPERVEAAIERLAPADSLRAHQPQGAKRRSEFVSGRLLIQQCLFSIYGSQAEGWALSLQPDGGLLLKGPENVVMPAISLSHSHGKVVCALAETPALGVDIELAQARKHLLQLAEETLHTHELADFSKLDAAGKLQFFYSKWVLKEALGKAMGCGISYPMRECRLDAGSLIEAPAEWGADLGHWAFSHSHLGDGYHLGLAWQGDSSSCISIKNIEIRI